MMSSPGKGQCLCGVVKFKVALCSHSVGACHCEICRKWGGGPFLAVDCGSDVSFEGEGNISIFQSSEWAERGFCTHCGSHLFYRLKSSRQYFIPAGLLDDFDAAVLDHQVFIDAKPDWYDFSNDTKDMTGEEMFAAFATPDN